MRRPKGDVLELAAHIEDETSADCIGTGVQQKGAKEATRPPFPNIHGKSAVISLDGSAAATWA